MVEADKGKDVFVGLVIGGFAKAILKGVKEFSGELEEIAKLGGVNLLDPDSVRNLMFALDQGYARARQVIENTAAEKQASARKNDDERYRQESERLKAEAMKQTQSGEGEAAKRDDVTKNVCGN